MRLLPRRLDPDLLIRFGVSVGAVGAATLIRLLLVHLPVEQEGSFLLFLGAVMVAAWFGGLGPGLFATALSGLVINFLFTQPALTLGFTNPGDAVRLALYAGEGAVISVLAESLHRARRRSELSEAEARQLERRILEISDDERRRVGHDLHDGLGQHLTGIAFLSKALQAKLTARGSAESGDAVKIAELVSESVGWTRDLARGLEPIGLDADGLQGALHLLAANTDRLVGIDCSFEPESEELQLSASEAMHLYRITQEAVNNAVRHARAKRIRVALRQLAGRVRVSIEDDGVGLPPPPSQGSTPSPGGTGESPGMGLQIMRYRARMIGATLSIGRGDAGGTRVVCELPVPDRATQPQRPPASGRASTEPYVHNQTR